MNKIAEIREILHERITKIIIESHRKQISIKARPGFLSPKKSGDQRAFRIS